MHETNTPSHHILFSNLHPNWMKLRHLWKGTASCDEIPCALEAIPRVDKGTIHNHHRSCQSPILEITSKPQSMHCKMACWPLGI
jgi:hypothetical protein